MTTYTTVPSTRVDGGTQGFHATVRTSANPPFTKVHALLKELKKTDSSPTQHELGNVPPALVQNWLVEDIGGRGVVDRAQTTIQINKDETAHGSTGLNRFTANPQITGETLSEGKITFGDFPITRRAGPPALMDQEAKFLITIQKVRKFHIDENQLLHLLDDNDNKVMRLSLLK